MNFLFEAASLLAISIKGANSDNVRAEARVVNGLIIAPIVEKKIAFFVKSNKGFNNTAELTITYVADNRFVTEVNDNGETVNLSV